MLLAAERWPDAELPVRSIAGAIAAEAKRWIGGIIERTALQGHHEYDSTGYHIEHMTLLVCMSTSKTTPCAHSRQVLTCS